MHLLQIFFDGLVARRFEAVSDVGKLLDPLADKILVMAALVCLVAQRSDVYGEPWVPAWIVVIILGREIWVTGLRAVAGAKGKVIAAGSTGKYKSALQMLAITILILHYPYQFGSTEVNFAALGLAILIVSVALSLWSAIDYTCEVFSEEQ